MLRWTKTRTGAALIDPFFRNNPITLQMLGICSALAVTTRMDKALVMAAALTFVAGVSSLLVSLIRKLTPTNIRIIVQLTIVSSLVIVVDQVLKAYVYEISLQLSVYVGLIITNCIVLGRIEGYAMQNPPLLSFIDGVGNGIGYGMILLAVGFVRELLGTGRVFGHVVLKTVDEGGWYTPNSMFLLAPAAFFIIAAIIWALRTWKPEQQESE
ncbi:MAG: NADH:ubiquinone reductase (Na(+)-transporting) subunit D [Gammaproteobacteria bacterium]|nr:NADH:ubiquinone reductase (Na(+)-transporting) subunit D [Gammaproteobacteria bacterium]